MKNVPNPKDNDDSNAINNSRNIFLDPFFIWYIKNDAVSTKPTEVRATASVGY